MYNVFQRHSFARPTKFRKKIHFFVGRKKQTNKPNHTKKPTTNQTTKPTENVYLLLGQLQKGLCKYIQLWLFVVISKYDTPRHEV